MVSIILTGGQGTRLGNKNKTFLTLGKTTILEHLILRLKEASFDEIIICGGQLSADEMSEYELQITTGRLIADCPVTFIKDITPHQGPLVGLYSGLVASKSFYNFVVAGDMPFLSTDLIKYMKEKVNDADIVVPKTRQGIEPLHAIYSKNCLGVIKLKIEDEKEKHSLDSIFSQLKIKYISEEEICQFSLPEIAFLNINTPEELEKAKRLVKENRGYSPKNLQGTL